MRGALNRIGAVLVLAASTGPACRGEAGPSPASPPDQEYLSPAALAVTADGNTLFAACATADKIAVYDFRGARIARWIKVPASPTGLVLSKAGSRLYVTCGAATGMVCVVEVQRGEILARWPAGHTPLSPVLSVDEKTLFVCNRFENDISFFELAGNSEVRRVRVSREPVAAAATPDGRYLLVANHLYDREGDDPGVAASISVIDIPAGRLAKRIKLARGSNSLRGIAVSPDGRYAAATHLLARYYLPTFSVESGRMNGNVLSLLDLTRLEVFKYVILDEADRGAANPWAVAWAPDGMNLVVTHAGTHEVSVVEAPVRPQKSVRVRQRIPLQGNGPRALAMAGARVLVANYFSDDLSVIDLSRPDPRAETVALAPARESSPVRRGERLFNDATLCQGAWQSCASCHDSDARTDGLGWDLLNDGINNPKNAKSLVWSHQTAPVMWMGVRENAETAVRAGLRYILFTQQPEAVPAAMDAYLRSLHPAPSPRLVGGRLSAAAERGKQTFFDAEVGCARCHPPPLFTDCKTHDVGTLGRYDQPQDRFDTPALVELWRTSPYLHDGAAANLREVLIQSNRADRHGKTSHLSPAQVDDLVEYLASL
jgi:DNA-binding beta-propeller fold protein YncE